MVGLRDIFRYPDAKLVGTLPVPGLDLGFNLIASSERIWDPPCKIRLLGNLSFQSIFRCNNRVSLLEILQCIPGCFPIFPFKDKVPPFCRPTHVFISVLASGIHIIAAKIMAVFSMVKYFFQIDNICFHHHLIVHICSQQIRYLNIL